MDAPFERFSWFLNNRQAFFGFYPVRQHAVTVHGDKRSVYDVLGKDTVLFPHDADADESSSGSQYVDQARLWFNSMWDSISRDLKQ